MFFNGYQNPKLAAIRLLRSQGCCNTTPQPKQQSTPVISGELENLLRYKQQLEAKVAYQRAKMADIPCAIQLAQQIEQLQQIIEGLVRENKQRVRLMQTTIKQINTTQSTELEDEEEDIKENERLQAQYNMLMKKLQKTNDRNTLLVNRLINF